MSKNFPRHKPTNSMGGAQTRDTRPTIHALCGLPCFQRPIALRLSVLRTRTDTLHGFGAIPADEQSIGF